ncbi:MAG: hypothetical protein M5U22_09700 [Thermoleophilia bacterium]|nr:hypothetical protein [Thermoleophilia bacterium]
MKGGYCGKILRVDLDAENFTDEPLPEDPVLRKFVGGWGLGLYFYSREYKPGFGFKDPRTPLIFTTGPLTGTRVPSATNTTAVTLNSETGYTTARSHSHGAFGQKLKAAGYDGIIITGRAKKPVYLWIDDSGPRLYDAAGVWGLDTHDTEDAVKAERGIEEGRKASVAAIGPAGENVCHGALIQNDKHHSFSHAGTGAVMGAKNLKAIGTAGTAKVPVHDPAALKESAKLWRESLLGCEMGQFWVAGGKDAAGRHSVWEYDKRESLISAQNFQRVSPPEWLDDIEDIAEVRKKGCPGCPLGCSYEVEIHKGPFAGQVFTPSGGGENMEGSASIIGVYDTARVYMLTDTNDRMGFEAGAAGTTLALAIEAYKKGLLTREDTDGLELRWGDADLGAALIRKMAHREGAFGEILALGAPGLARRIGGEALDMVAHVKGGSINHHDWRASWGIFFGQIVGGASGWPAPGVTNFTTEPSIGYDTFQEPLTPEGKPLASRMTGMLKFYNDSVGTCWNSLWGVPRSLQSTTECIAAATGWDFTPEEALTLGERLMNLERVCNLRNGFTKTDDFDIGPRLLQAPTEGRAKGRSIKPFLPGMIDEYYELMGWDVKTGRPYRATLERLGLEEYALFVWTD